MKIQLILELKIKYLILLVAFVTIFLFIGGPDNYSIRTFRTAWGLGHFVCFALWAYLYSLFRPHLTFKRYVFEVLLLTTVFGGLSELIQPYVGRTALWSDLWQDMVGAMLGAVFFAAHRKQLATIKLRLLQIPVVLILLFYLLPLGQVMVDDVIAWRQFPLLSGFETPLEQSRWGRGLEPVVVNDPVFAGKGALRVELATTKYSGIGLKHFPRDWSGYAAISMQVYNASPEPLDLRIRIHDVHHTHDYEDRFNTTFLLEPGWNHLRINLAEVAAGPKQRQLDLTRVGGLGLFVVEQEERRVIVIDEVRLE